MPKMSPPKAKYHTEYQLSDKLSQTAVKFCKSWIDKGCNIHGIAKQVCDVDGNSHFSICDYIKWACATGYVNEEGEVHEPYTLHRDYQFCPNERPEPGPDHYELEKEPLLAIVHYWVPPEIIEWYRENKETIQGGINKFFAGVVHYYELMHRKMEMRHIFGQETKVIVERPVDPTQKLEL